MSVICRLYSEMLNKNDTQMLYQDDFVKSVLPHKFAS